MKPEDMPAEFQKLFQQFERAAELTLKEAGELGVETAQDTNKFKIGKLKDAIQFHPIDKLSGFVLADKPYAHWLEDGNDENGPFIVATNAKCLHFYVDGDEVFAKKVKSHGPYHFMQDSQDKVVEELPAIFEKNFNKSG
jgi:Bacteriophage HK97-gp10, putative tail-component